MLVIGIAGGSGSGKTTVVRELVKRLPKDSVSVISQDFYYRDKGHLTPEEKRRINFDHPDSIEFSLLNQHLDALAQGHTVQRPIYSYVTCARSKETLPLSPRRVVIVEGILIFTDQELCKRLDVKVYVDADSDDRLMRIIHRDIRDRGRSYSDVLSHYEMWVKPMHQTFIEPTKRYADLIIPQGGANKIAIDILSSRIKEKLNE
ncbi:MAG: uridine kinase [Bacteroidetes bacterium]|nr:MAG: uridine kinase [Bacteroidota bacterium]PIE87968.1 MAG: uridine kinase [Bacteroidota bacterium]